MHREENVDHRENLKHLLSPLILLVKFNLDIIISTHPRTKDRLKKNSFKI